MGLYLGGLLSEGFLHLRFGGLFSGGLIFIIIIIFLAGGLIIGILRHINCTLKLKCCALYEEGNPRSMRNYERAQCFDYSLTGSAT